MVLEAASDIRHAERALREIDVLNQQGASGAGSLESGSWYWLVLKLILGLLPYKGDLIEGLQETHSRSRELRESRKEVADLLRRYNEFVRHHAHSLITC
jgi:hypothetical protein